MNPYANINITNKWTKSIIKACQESEEKFKKIKEKLRIFENGYREIDLFILNLYVKAKLKESTLRRLAKKRYINIYRNLDENAIM